jgi:hypothetical protein
VSELNIRIQGLSTDIVGDATRQIVSDLRRQIETVVGADDPDERETAAADLLAAAVLEGARFAWSELAAQLIEAGVGFEGKLDIDTPLGGDR